MKTITKEQLATILELHDKWLNDVTGGERADLTEANLTGANLTEADLTEADLTEADLSGANLSEANLSEANLSWANLRGVNLSEADLSEADLRGANLTGANLSGANLSWANLRGVNLSEADLSEADLRGANLTGANLIEADLSAIKEDLFNSLALVKDEVPFLRRALVEGKIDGTQYNGECRCLAGTIANACKKEGEVHSGDEVHNGFKADSASPRERWFLAIREGYTPENNQVAKITLEWIDEFLKNTRKG